MMPVLERFLCEHPNVATPRATMERIVASRKAIEGILKSGRTVYGVNTGFGKMCTTRISDREVGELQENLILTHAGGVLPYLPKWATEFTMLLRLNALARGHSGICESTYILLQDMLNGGVIPAIPSIGSLGASGDLAPLAHLALAMMGKGLCLPADIPLAQWLGNASKSRLVPTAKAMKSAGLKPVRLAAKEGLALINGTAACTAVAAGGLIELLRLYNLANVAAALSHDAILATDAHFDEALSAAKGHPGQVATAAQMRMLMQGSEIRRSHVDCERVQDSYSFRCVPQVHGAVLTCIANARRTVEREMNTSNDNPLILSGPTRVVSGGNFHAEEIALACDNLALAAHELAAISERRTNAILDPEHNQGLPAFLASKPGLDSGLMMAQYLAVALLAEIRVLANPASLHSLPVSADQEDFVSGGMTAALKLYNALAHVWKVIAIELVCAVTAVNMRRPLKSSAVLEKFMRDFGRTVGSRAQDEPLSELLERAYAFADGGSYCTYTPRLTWADINW